MLSSARRELRADPYLEELAEIESQLDEQERRLDDFASELFELGIEPKNAAEGLVDFPAQRRGRIVYLCWKLDEPHVQFWHPLEAGFAGRQAIRPAEWDAARQDSALQDTAAIELG
jgi:hypothetical protein